MTSASKTERSPQLERVSGRVPFSIMGVHNADSAESSLYTLLAYPTALHSSLISPVNVSLGLIGKELAAHLPLQVAVGGATDIFPKHVGEASEDLLLYAKNSLHRQINQYTLECRGTIPGEAMLLSSHAENGDGD